MRPPTIIWPIKVRTARTFDLRVDILVRALAPHRRRRSCASPVHQRRASSLILVLSAASCARARRVATSALSTQQTCDELKFMSNATTFLPLLLLLLPPPLYRCRCSQRRRRRRNKRDENEARTICVRQVAAKRKTISTVCKVKQRRRRRLRTWLQMLWVRPRSICSRRTLARLCAVQFQVRLCDAATTNALVTQ